MKDLEQKILSLAEDGKIKGKDLLPLVSAYGPLLLTALSQLKSDGVIRDSFSPVKGTIYDMDYDVFPVVNKNLLLYDKYPLSVMFKHRKPDPGICKVISIDWEERKMSVSNGAVRLFPGFSDVFFV